MNHKTYYKEKNAVKEEFISKKTHHKEKDTVKEEYLKLQNKCYLCGNNLDTHVESLSKSHFIVEKAQCKNCMTMVRVKNHSLH